LGARTGRLQTGHSSHRSQGGSGKIKGGWALQFKERVANVCQFPQSSFHYERGSNNKISRGWGRGEENTREGRSTGKKGESDPSSSQRERECGGFFQMERWSGSMSRYGGVGGGLGDGVLGKSREGGGGAGRGGPLSSTKKSRLYCPCSITTRPETPRGRAEVG